jgi:hypothetical protein
MAQVQSDLSQVTAARTMNIDRRTIRRWSRANGFPERRPIYRVRTVDLHHDYLEQRWQQGCHNAA